MYRELLRLFPVRQASSQEWRETFVTAVNVWNALYKCDRFMIRLPAKFDLAAPETDSEAESYEDMKCI